MALRPIDRCPKCGSKTVRISWSALKTHEECRQRGMLYRQKKRAVVKDVRNFFPGRVTDRVVRDWLADDPHNNPKLMPLMVESVVERELTLNAEEGELVSWRNNTDRAHVIQQCITAVERIEPALNRYVLPYQWQVDFGFKAPLLMRAPDGGMDRVVLNGYMDIIVFDPTTETWRVYDVKHTEDKNYWKGSFGQLAFYSLATLIMFGKMPVEVGFFQPLVDEQVKRFAITDIEVNALSARLQTMADQVWREDFEPRMDPTPCFYCDVKHACSKFTPIQDGNRRRVKLF